MIKELTLFSFSGFFCGNVRTCLPLTPRNLLLFPPREEEFEKLQLICFNGNIHSACCIPYDISQQPSQSQFNLINTNILDKIENQAKITKDLWKSVVKDKSS